MFRFGLFAFGFFATVNCLTSFAGDFEDAVQISNCRFWTYSSAARGYVCSGHAGTESVPTAYEFSRLAALVQEQARQLAQLGARVEKLENP